MTASKPHTTAPHAPTAPVPTTAPHAPAPGQSPATHVPATSPGPAPEKLPASYKPEPSSSSTREGRAAERAGHAPETDTFSKYPAGAVHEGDQAPVDDEAARKAAPLKEGDPGFGEMKIAKTDAPDYLAQAEPVLAKPEVGGGAGDPSRNPADPALLTTAGDPSRSANVRSIPDVITEKSVYVPAAQDPARNPNDPALRSAFDPPRTDSAPWPPVEHGADAVDAAGKPVVGKHGLGTGDYPNTATPAVTSNPNPAPGKHGLGTADVPGARR